MKKDNKPKISVIIPAHNEEGYIEKALNSIKSQIYPNIETIVICNGCTDKTAEISGLYTSNIYEMHERGVSKARNLGIEKSSGEIITFLDADSSMEKTLAEKANKAMSEDYSGGKAKVIPNVKSFKARLYCSYVNFCSDLSQLLTRFDKEKLNGAGVFMFTDRDHIERLKWKYGKIFNENLQTMEDVEFLRKLRKEGPLKFIKDSHVITSTRRLDKEGYFNGFITDYLDYFSPKGKKRAIYR